jgi:hypothetical protein
MKSWKTTAAGIGGLMTAIGSALNQLFDGNPATNPDWNLLLPIIFTSLIGIFARDNNVTSEQAGANDPGKPPTLANASRLPLLLLIGLLAATVALPLAITGCGSTPQRVSYQSAATTTVTVETALRAYNEFAKAGKTTPEQNAKVKAAYVKYQAAFAVVCDAGAIYAASGGTNAPANAALQQAIVNSGATITDLINLVTTFGVKL